MAISSLTTAPAKDPSAENASTRRLLSVDALRGVTIAFMIMVNDKGGPGAWCQMSHSTWNGMTATDVVFPTFLFLVGISIVFSVEARLRHGASQRQLAWHTVKRAAIMFGLGIVVNSSHHFNLAHLRIYGVLQRIAICYLIIGLFYLWDRRVWNKVVMLAVVLAGYWVLVQWVPVPAAGVPGRDIPFLDRNQNIVAWVDRNLMPGHLYEDAPLHDARDPEGLLSDIPALGTTLIGLLAGLWLLGGKAVRTKMLGLAAGGVVCLSAGYLWSIWFPLNKKLWTSSYVLASAGWSLALLALSFWAVEQKGWCKAGRSKAWIWPWLVFGSNAIVAYMISELLSGALDVIRFSVGKRQMDPMTFTYMQILKYIHNPGWTVFVFSLTYTTVCFIPVWILYRKKIFVKI